jgi:hypothetical protein
MNGVPDTVDQWAPIFLYFVGTRQPKYTDEQVLRPEFALSIFELGTYCKLCDVYLPIGTRQEKHMARHARELKSWRAKEEARAERERAARLAQAREEKAREKALERSVA